MEKKSKDIIRTQEPLVSYEQVLLSQVDYCGKVSITRFPLCVDYLISLLPQELRGRVLERLEEITTIVKSLVLKQPYCFKEQLKLGICSISGLDYPNHMGSVLEEIRRKHQKLYERYSYILPSVVRAFTYVHEDPHTKVPLGIYKLKAALAIEALMEEGIIGPKERALAIGVARGKKSVPR